MAAKKKTREPLTEGEALSFHMTLELDRALVDLLRARAEEDGRSFSSLAGELLDEEALEGRGKRVCFCISEGARKALKERAGKRHTSLNEHVRSSLERAMLRRLARGERCE